MMCWHRSTWNIVHRIGEINMVRSKKSILKSINSLEKRIKEHEQKILDAIESNKNLHVIDHWEKEINLFRQQIKELKRKVKR